MPELKNIMESLVTEKVDEYIKANRDFCSCEMCRLDLMALVLNSFPPKYVVTEAGENYSRLSSLSMQFKVDLVTAVIQSAGVIRNNPRHGNKSME